MLYETHLCPFLFCFVFIFCKTLLKLIFFQRQELIARKFVANIKYKIMVLDQVTNDDWKLEVVQEVLIALARLKKRFLFLRH